MSVQDYKINYKSDFVLNINGDAGWTTQFCIKFWTGMPSQAYFVGFDGVKYVNCRVGDTPTQLLVMFDDHHLPIGKLMMQIAYHTTIEEFPGSVFDEVTNARDVIVTIDGTDYQVLLDFTGEDAPELEFDLPAYANEAERIQNELQRQQNEADRIAAELQREQATAAAVQGAENVNAQLNGTTLTVTNRQGVSTSVNTKGEQGEQGPAGPEGPQGEQGVSIVSFLPKSETSTTLIYTITYSNGYTQDVAIPKGPKGDTGATGPTGPQGPQGDTGVSITGFIETGETETATLYNITFSNGTTQAVAIPKGEKGDQGEQGPQGPQGPMGDVAVITPEQQAAFTMYSVPGQNTDGPMTQKAVTDSLVAEAISYDNSQSGIEADNVQEAIDKVSSNVFENFKEEVVPLTGATNMYIRPDGLWSKPSDSGGYLMPIEDADKYYYRLTAANNANARVIALLDDSAVSGKTASFVTGDYNTSRILAKVGTSVIFRLPQGTNYIWVSRLQLSLDNTPRIEKLQSLDEIVGEIRATEVYYGKGLNNDGTLFDAGSAGAAVYKYSVSEGNKYAVSGYSPADSNLTRVSVVCADTDGVALSSYKPCKSSAFNDYVIETPKNCTHILVFNNASGPASLKNYHNTFENTKIESIPQIYNDGHKFYRGSNLKILCFGSSWFMDTWWYLNKLLGDAGVSCELHCYYMGHAKMREWLEFYNGNTTPFSGTEATRSASKNISVNGADWTTYSYSQSGSYNANSYKDDFVADIKSGDWDIIAFQQGAQECIIAEEWDAKHDVVKMIKENCSYKTTIAFNATFAPALKNYSGTYFPTISRSDYGKEYFQYLNNRNTKLFMADTGIYNVSPNGAMLSLMRTDATLNLSNDMANDGLHPNNGLPILGLCGCFYETFIAPLIGISFDELDWLPTSSTQKASVSGSSYQSCSDSQLVTLKNYVKQALADRFKYYK